MEITTLVENSCHDRRLQEEFGLSLLIKSGESKILFDMGASSLFADNAEVMGIDLGEVDCAVLSHAHYDHGGGLETFLRCNRTAEIFLGRESDGLYFGNIGARLPLALHPFLYPLVAKSEWFSRPIGLNREVLAGSAERLVYVDGCREIRKNFFLLTDIAKDYDIPEGNRYLLVKKDGHLQPDTFVHELIMVVREADGLVLFTGCGHGGILNMLKTVGSHFSGERIKAVVGGFHLSLQPGRPRCSGTRADIEHIADELAATGADRVVTGHCTGDDACAILKEKLGEKLICFATGSVCRL